MAASINISELLKRMTDFKEFKFSDQGIVRETGSFQYSSKTIFFISQSQGWHGQKANCRVRSGQLVNFSVGRTISSLSYMKVRALFGKEGATKIGMRAFGRIQMILSTLKPHCISLTKKKQSLPPLAEDASVVLPEDLIIASSGDVILYRNSGSPHALYLCPFIPTRLITSSRSSMPIGANLKSQTWMERFTCQKNCKIF